MKKILILVMSCNDSFFDNQCEVLKQTWAKDIIDGKYPNIELIIYKGTTSQSTYVKDKHLLYVRAEDDLLNTYKKTFYTFNIVETNFEYDYIFRTNTSTYVNVPLLNMFIQSLDDDSICWTSDLYSLSEANTPYPLTLYARGNGMILSKKLINIILKDGINLLYLEQTDDTAIGNVLNSWWIKNDENPLNHLRAYRHGWYKSITDKVPNNHSLCIYGSDNISPEFLRQFITIQVKSYLDRSVETEHYYELHEAYKSFTDTDIVESVKLQYEYSLNPNVFIGSILGYVLFDVWAKLPINELYMLEMTHKASNDAEYYKDKKILL